MQNRIVRFICAHSHAKEEVLTQLMLRPDQIANDCGSVLEAEEAVRYGLINEVGGVDRALSMLREMKSHGRKRKNKNKTHSKNNQKNGK